MTKINQYTIQEFRAEFPNEKSCLDYIFSKRFPNATQYYHVAGRKCYANPQGKQIHPVKGTIFEKSSTPLTLWFYAIYLFSVSKNGVSGKELQRQLGVTYKTAWRMAKQIRALMKHDGKKLFGTVEVDETYMGGTRRMSVKMENKIPVIGMVERKGRIVAKHIPDRYNGTLLKNIQENVETGSQLMTDEWKAYKYTSRLGYSHRAVKHGVRQFARGIANTNTIEGFWSQLKRSVHGTYHSVSKKYLQSYVDEFSFRYNHRALPVFEAMMARI
jgi:transposase-like protein